MINTYDQTFRTMFNNEFKEDFERDKPILPQTVRSDGLQAGSTIKWDVIDPSDQAETRTRDGDIPESQLGLSQVSGTVKEHFKKYRIDSFDDFRGNPNVRMMMAKKARLSIYKAVDQEIIDALDAGTLAINSGNAIGFHLLSTFLTWTTTLWANEVPNDGQVWGALTPKAEAQMMRIEEYKNSRYVSMQPAKEGQRTVGQGFREWLGVKWFVHTGLTGIAGATAKCYIYHSSAVAHQMAGEPAVHPYYLEEQDRHECWARAWHVGKTVLNRGIIRAVHDDTAAFA